MSEPVLVVMAAGMGSRYGGLKQMDPMGTNGELIIDFSLYDAYRAGFRKAVFIIKKEMEGDFREIMKDRAARKMEISYAFQELTDLPEGFEIPADRVKPWGTGHAVLSARELVDAPFAVINADDYYGVSGFASIYDFLKNAEDDERYRYCMVGYQVENTLTEHGSVARGVCTADRNGDLTDIVERTKIFWDKGDIVFTEDDRTFTKIEKGTPVSMNLWGFTLSFMKELAAGFPAFLETTLKENPLKGEYFLPFVVDRLIREGKATVRVLTSADRWYGVTYKEDKEQVVEALRKMKEDGRYPQSLWD